MEETKCIFCLISSKATKSNIVYEDEKIVGVLDINPATNGHVIIIPKAHYNSLYEMPQNEYLAFLLISRAIAYALVLSMGATNVDLIYTQELRKGTFTPHALIHAIPRYNEDTVNYIWQQKPLSEEEAAQISATISEAMEKVKSGGEIQPPSGGETQSNQNSTTLAPAKPKDLPQEKPEKKEEKPFEIKKKTVIF